MFSKLKQIFFLQETKNISHQQKKFKNKKTIFSPRNKKNYFSSRNKIPAAEKLRSDLMEQSVVVKNKAEAAKNESTDIFTNAGKLTVPVVDTEQMDREAQIIQDEAEKLMPQVTAFLAYSVGDYMQFAATLC